MAVLSQYLLRLIVGTLICGIVMSLVQDTGQGPWIRTLCGMILAAVLLGPMTDLRWESDFSALPESFRAGQQQAASGQEMARQEQALCISQALEAYILDKAAQAGAALTVTVSLGEDLLPAGAELRGQLAPRVKEILSDMMEQELGIAKENQLWTG